MKILIDTNFILTCMKQKIDFPNLAEELFDEKIKHFTKNSEAKQVLSTFQQ